VSGADEQDRRPQYEVVDLDNEVPVRGLHEPELDARQICGWGLHWVPPLRVGVFPLLPVSALLRIQSPEAVVEPAVVDECVCRHHAMEADGGAKCKPVPVSDDGRPLLCFEYPWLGDGRPRRKVLRWTGGGLKQEKDQAAVQSRIESARRLFDGTDAIAHFWEWHTPEEHLEAAKRQRCWPVDDPEEETALATLLWACLGLRRTWRRLSAGFRRPRPCPTLVERFLPE